MSNLSIGEKIKQMRIKLGLTQEELAARTELSKGFISQLERDLTSPSIATLMDILETLGTTIQDFFNETVQEKIVYTSDDVFVKENADEGHAIEWLVTDSQKNAVEPIKITLHSGGRSSILDAHEGEEFGYVLSGNIVLVLGNRRVKVKKGDSFYFKANSEHYIENAGKLEAKVLWISTPPSF